MVNKKMVIIKKIIAISIISALVLISALLINRYIVHKTEPIKYKSEREVVAADIANGKYIIAENGWVELPQEKKQLSYNGKCSFVQIDNNYGVYYFESYNALLSTARGYLCVCDNVSDEIKKSADRSWIFVRMRKVSDTWYDVSTENN